jgi:hypothetical protein
VKVPSLPNPQQHRGWKSAIRIEIAAANRKGDEGFTWALKAESASVTYEELADSDGFASLDSKLAAALTKIANGELGRRITLAVENEALRGRMLRGRQILWLIHEFHKYDEEQGALYDFTDLTAVKLRNDSGLEAFITSWLSVLTGMKHPPEETIIEVVCLEQLRNAHCLKEELAHYDSARKDTPERSYAFLSQHSVI